MRHPHHLPPNVPAAARAPSADAMGVLIRPEPLQRTCMELGVCQADGRCDGCAPVKPPASDAPAPLWERWAYAVAMAALYGGTAGVALGALKYLLDVVGS
jgi:hypothetical protein